MYFLQKYMRYKDASKRGFRFTVRKFLSTWRSTHDICY